MTRLVFIAPNDWIIAAYHLPILRAAAELGLKPTVIAADWGRRQAIEQTGRGSSACRGRPGPEARPPWADGRGS